ncbi:MAG: alkaline phosphatase family protein [Candidatus Omnitrophota bacterium]
MMLNKKAFVIGLDCLTPQLVFGKYLDCMPTVKRLLNQSLWGKMRSTLPPITCPAWASMVTSKDPGQLGIYGFRNRANHSYDKLTISTSDFIKEKTLWDILKAQGKKSIVVGVPPSYPPKRINGIMTGCFLTPGEDAEYTSPGSIREEIRKSVGDYKIDVKEFRTSNKDKLLKEIYELSDNRFSVAKYLMKNKEWDFFMFVDMGPDRIHHGFWKYCDPTHKKFKKGNKYINALKDYYIVLDKKIGDIIKNAGNDATIYIVSDHGAKRIDGCFCINEWLIKKGYLALKYYPKKITRFSPDLVNWEKTFAWGEGGYYGRIFLNVKGREPRGIVEKKDYDKLRQKLIRELKKIKYKKSKAKKTVVYTPEELYSEIKGIPPDILVFFGDLYWRSAGKVGFKDIYTFENDTGPDDANHDYDGIFIMHDKKIKRPRQLKGISIYDFAPTVLHNMGMEVPGDMEGKILQ